MKEQAKKTSGQAFYGVATIGTKGQVVIPAEAREEMSIQPGDKVIVIGRQHPTKGFGMICICPVESAEQFVNELTSQITRTQEAIKQARSDNN